jgi:hypothetical protein
MTCAFATGGYAFLDLGGLASLRESSEFDRDA